MRPQNLKTFILILKKRDHHHDIVLKKNTIKKSHTISNSVPFKNKNIYSLLTS